MLLVFIAGLLILGGVTKLHAEVRDKGGEAGCKLFNLLRAKTSTEFSGLKVGLPRACKTIHLNGEKEELPQEKYEQSKNGINENIRDLIIKCWDMWLKGKEPNMFQRFYGFADGGYICYTYPINREVLPEGQRITLSDFNDFLAQPYIGIDKTDRCNEGGEGGKCAVGDPNNKNACLSVAEGDAFARNIKRSERCSPKEVCCVASKDGDGCKNKGGKCFEEATGDYTHQFNSDSWACADSGLKCFLRRQDVVTTFDYIQGTGGSDTGPGVILYRVPDGENVDNFHFKSGERYAISFVSPGKDADLNTALGAGGTTGVIVGGAALLYGTYKFGKYAAAVTGPVGWLAIGASELLENAIIVGIVYGTYKAGSATLATGSLNDINYLIISKYSTVEGKYMEKTEASVT